MEKTAKEIGKDGKPKYSLSFKQLPNTNKRTLACPLQPKWDPSRFRIIMLKAILDSCNKWENWITDASTSDNTIHKSKDQSHTKSHRKVIELSESENDSEKQINYWINS